MLTTLPSPITDFAVLASGKSAEVVARLMELRPHWITRNLYVPFFTLGAASYLDATPATAWRYRAWSAESNTVLRQHFSPLYDAVLAAIEKLTGDRAMYAPHLALPGFHIYLSSPVFEKPVASIHFDSQFNLHEWPAGAELDHPISFTLPVALPACGGGLLTWDLPKSEMAMCTDEEVATLTRTHAASFHAYSVGHLALHSGNVLHQAAPGRNLGPNDMRITLQGHGVRVRGSWQLYW